jgi:hypothetical protein
MKASDELDGTSRGSLEHGQRVYARLVRRAFDRAFADAHHNRLACVVDTRRARTRLKRHINERPPHDAFYGFSQKTDPLSFAPP